MKKIITVIIIVFVVIIVSVFINIKSNDYDVVEIKKGNVIEAVYGLGVVRSMKTYEVKIGLMEKISNLYVKEGDRIQKGQGIISFERAINFKAPFSGTVTYVGFQQGEVVPPQIPIVRLEDLKHKYIEVSLEQEAALKIVNNQKAKIVFESLKQHTYEGRVSSIFPKDREFIARIAVTSLDDNILPGMSADIIIEVGKKLGVLLIPIKAINLNRAIKLKNNKKEKVEVKIGQSDGFFAELISDTLEEGDTVIIQRK